MKVHWKRWIYLFMLVFIFERASVVQAATELVYEVLNPENLVAGNKIEIVISIKNNPGLTTTGLRLVYDNAILKYEGETWIEDLKGENGNLTLVSDVDYAQKKALNISFIDSSGYMREGEFITLYFEVLKDFSGCPTELIFRDASDKDEKSIIGKVQGNEIEFEQIPDIVLPDEELDDSCEEVVEGEKYDETFKTGAVSVESILNLLCLSMGTIGSICALWIKRSIKDERREVQNIMGFRAD